MNIAHDQAFDLEKVEASRRLDREGAARGQHWYEELPIVGDHLVVTDSELRKWELAGGPVVAQMKVALGWKFFSDDDR